MRRATRRAPVIETRQGDAAAMFECADPPPTETPFADSAAGDERPGIRYLDLAVEYTAADDLLIRRLADAG